MRLFSIAACLAGAHAAMVAPTEGFQKRLDRANAPRSWQKRLDKAVFSVDATPQQRLRLLQKVQKDASVAREDVRAAASALREKGFAEGHGSVIDLLWPAGTTGRADLQGLQALSKQVPELVQGFKPPSAAALRSGSTPSPTPPIDPAAVATALLGLATDTAKQRELLEEAKNALRSTPKGLETPAYDVVRTLDGGRVELRRYAPFTVARKPVAGVEGGAAAYNSAEGGAGFNALATYLFGGNDASQSMAMTMPVAIDSAAGGGASMAFVLPGEFADAPPAPLAGDVAIDRVPERLVAVRGFAGIVTDEEVARQRAAIGEALEADGVVPVEPDGSYSVLQYNAPYTVPWRRRNELAVVVSEPAAEAEAEAEAEAPAAEVVSWYDAGQRL